MIAQSGIEQFDLRSELCGLRDELRQEGLCIYDELAIRLRTVERARAGWYLDDSTKVEAKAAFGELRLGRTAASHPITHTRFAG